MNEPLTIIVPVHNREDIVGDTLNSIWQQTYRPLRLIIVDNNSADNTLGAVSHWAERVKSDDFDVTIISEKQHGAPAARNAGLALSDTRWTMFFDSDDIMLPHHISTAMKAVSNNPDAQIIGWDVNDNVLHKRMPFYATDALYHCIMHGSMATQRYMARTQLFRRCGQWCPDVERWNDIELGVRMLAHVKPDQVVKVKGHCGVEIRHVDISISGNDFSSSSEKLDHALLCMAHNLPENKKEIVSLKRAILAADYHIEGQEQLAQKEMARALQCSKHKSLLKFAFAYRKLGGIGAARLLSPIFR